MEIDIHNTLKGGEKVTSSYAEIYFDDDHCDNKIVRNPPPPPKISRKRQTILSKFNLEGDWVSPSDLLIDLIQLTPPLTSKVTRGITHEGILKIGNIILEENREEFRDDLERLLYRNEDIWLEILRQEKKKLKRKIKNEYVEKFHVKSKIMSEEISLFYEENLQHLEDHVRSEFQKVITAARAGIVSNLNIEIQNKLREQKIILENKLQNHYESEVAKIKKYYKLLLENERYRNKKIVNRSLHERNEALHIFYKQIEAETVTSTMYVMSLERKKCKIKQFLLDSHQTAEIKEKLQNIKEKREVVDSFRERDHSMRDINWEWECKIQKIVQIFLKFISYTLKLLPEQSTFLLELEKLVVLQLNEIQKYQKVAPSVLVEAPSTDKIFIFERVQSSKLICDKEPFVVVGDTSGSIPSVHGSRETLHSKVDLPSIRLERQYVYAKCDKFEEIKALLEAQQCKCRDMPVEESPDSSKSISITNEPEEQSKTVESESSIELMPVDDFKRVDRCPLKKCQDWLKNFSFPDLDSYLDFTETNFSRVQAILGKPREKEVAPKLINAKDIVSEELPFSATRELHHHAGTQYSSQEDILSQNVLIRESNTPCSCDSDILMKGKIDFVEEYENSVTYEMLEKRKNSLMEMLRTHPKLLKMLTDESFDFQL